MSGTDSSKGYAAPFRRSIIFEVRGTPEATSDAVEYLLDHMDERWSEFNCEWLGGHCWPTDEVFLMPCRADNPGPKDVVL